MGRPGSASIAALGACALLGGCIIPDSTIEVVGDLVNPGPVRLVQSVPITDEANAECSDVAKELGGCPLPPETVPFGRIVTELPFCVCDGTDQNRLSSFDIYVEDPDLDDDGRPADSIFGVFLLDPLPAADDLSEFVAYSNLLPPTQPARTVQLGFPSYADSLERPPPLLRSWTLGRDTGVDLCNDNADALDGRLEPGVHSLRLVVTDRPWYRSVVFDDDGKLVLDENKNPERTGDPHVGVPDTPAGASYAIADYVFACGDEDDPDAGCNCLGEPLPP